MDDLERISNALVEHSYGVALEPSGYDALIAAWETYADRVIDAQVTAREDVLSELGHIHAHFDRAHAILRRLGRSQGDMRDAQGLADSLPGAGLVMDHAGRVLAANAEMRTACGNTAPQSLSAILPDETAVARILGWARGRRLLAPAPYLFVTSPVGVAHTPACLFVTLIDRGDDDAGEDTRLIVSTVDLTFDADTASTIAGAFCLSDAEARIALALARGLSPGDIARERGSSINTVRSQIKSALAKSGVRGVPDLVRLVCGFAANQSAANIIARRKARLLTRSACRRECSLTLSSGRRLAFLDEGEPGGRPVLFFHNMLYGPFLTDAATESAAARGWRLVAPSRPGFGGSDFNPDVQDLALVDATCLAFRDLLDHLGIDRALLLGHQAGTIYAQRFALAFPQRTEGVLFVSHAPHWRADFLRDLPQRQRVIARTTQVSRRALSFLVRAAIGLIDAGREDQFLYALHKACPEDMRALRRPDVLATIVEGLRHTVAQDGRGFCADCPLVLSDWAHEARRLNVPLKILSGRADRLCNSGYFEPYLERFGPDVLRLVDGVGQFLLYSHWPLVFEQLDGLHAARKA